jgi:hypothetical protein
MESPQDGRFRGELDRFTQQNFAEMAAWEDHDDGSMKTTESLAIPSIVVSALVMAVAGMAVWFRWA